MLTTEQLEILRGEKPDGRNRIAQAMKLAGVTQVQLQQLTGFTQAYISKLKNGQYGDDLPGETMRAFATVFGCTIEDLFPAKQVVA